MRMLRTKPMSQIFEICFQVPKKQDTNQGVLVWHALSVKAITTSYEHHVLDKITPQTIISKIMHNSLQFIKDKGK